MDRIEIADVLEKLANGVNPETGKPDDSTNILETALAIRALFNAVTILKTNDLYSSDWPKEGRIEFYRTNGKYGFFSNFSKYPIELEGRTWPTSEHYFQAKKFEGTADEEKIRRAETPSMAAKMGRQRNRPLRSDWETVKDQIMRTALEAKFTQHKELKEKLAATKGLVIVERTKRDSYWGDGGDGNGKNMLGVMLMKLRDQLSNS